jgi:hypothetical protein
VNAGTHYISTEPWEGLPDVQRCALNTSTLADNRADTEAQRNRAYPSKGISLTGYSAGRSALLSWGLDDTAEHNNERSLSDPLTQLGRTPLLKMILVMSWPA